MKLLSFFKSNGLARDNLIFFAASMGSNLVGFFYHAFMGRILGPADYGVLGVLLSITYFLNVFLNVTQTAISRFVSTFKANNDYASISYLFARGLKYLFWIGLVGFVFYVLFGFFLTDFLHIPFRPYIYQGFMILFLFLLALNRGMLQGLQRFLALGLNNISEGIFKLLVGVLLVFLGLGVSGAIWGVTASYAAAFFISLIPLRDYFHAKKKIVKKKGIITYSLPVLFVLLALTALYSLDVFLVKHYFPAEEAGYYAAASLIGKIVLFATLSIVMVMFPKVSEYYERKAYYDVKRVLNLSLTFITLMSLGIFLFYVLFPEFVVLVLFGKAFLSVKQIIWLFAVVYWLYSMINALSMYNLSIHRYSFIPALFITNLAEVIIIVFFHQTLFMVLLTVAIVLLILLLFLLIYTYGHHLGSEHGSQHYHTSLQ